MALLHAALGLSVQYRALVCISGFTWYLFFSDVRGGVVACLVCVSVVMVLFGWGSYAQSFN